MAEVRPIDANALFDTIRNLKKFYIVEPGTKKYIEYGHHADDILAAVHQAPTLECEVVKHSNWELKCCRPVKVTADGEIHCPECHSVFTRIVGTWFKRCPECGTVMNGKKRDSL